MSASWSRLAGGLIVTGVAVQLIGILITGAVLQVRSIRPAKRPLHDSKSEQRVRRLLELECGISVADSQLIDWGARCRRHRRLCSYLIFPPFIIGAIGFATAAVGLVIALEVQYFAALNSNRVSFGTSLIRYGLLAAFFAICITLFLGMSLGLRGITIRLQRRSAELYAVDALMATIESLGDLRSPLQPDVVRLRQETSQRLTYAADCLQNVYRYQLANSAPSSHRSALLKGGDSHCHELKALTIDILTGSEADAEELAKRVGNHLSQICRSDFRMDVASTAADDLGRDSQRRSRRLLLLTAAAVLSLGVVYQLLSNHVLGSAGNAVVTTLSAVIGIVCVVLAVLGEGQGRELLTTARTLLVKSGNDTPEEGD